MNKTILSLDRELQDVPFTLIGTTLFKDHKEEDAMIIPRQFRSLDDMRECLHLMAERCVVYVRELWEMDFGEPTGIRYYLHCAYRAKTSID